MEFGAVPVTQAAGAVLAHSVALPDGKLKKGRVLSPDEVARLETAGELLDPHTAIATAAARDELRPEISAVIALATAHAAKFPDAVEKASGNRPALPPRLADLYEREERCTTLPNDLVALQDYIRAQKNDPPKSAKQQAKGAA